MKGVRIYTIRFLSIAGAKVTYLTEPVDSSKYVRVRPRGLRRSLLHDESCDELVDGLVMLGFFPVKVDFVDSVPSMRQVQSFFGPPKAY